jgi:hypothetical protein
MQLAYPVSRGSKLSDSLLALKIARHRPCSLCSSCSGLRPPPGVEVINDDPPSSLGDLGQYGSDDEDLSPVYLDACLCGHGVMEHGADPTVIGVEEFGRLGRVAFRMDEYLQVSIIHLLTWSPSNPLVGCRQAVRLQLH